MGKDKETIRIVSDGSGYDDMYAKADKIKTKMEQYTAGNRCSFEINVNGGSTIEVVLEGEAYEIEEVRNRLKGLLGAPNLRLKIEEEPPLSFSSHGKNDFNDPSAWLTPN